MLADTRLDDAAEALQVAERVRRDAVVKSKEPADRLAVAAADNGADLRSRLDHAIGAQHLQRLAHRVAPGLELFAKIALGRKRIADTETALGDHVADLLDQPVHGRGLAWLDGLHTRQRLFSYRTAHRPSSLRCSICWSSLRVQSSAISQISRKVANIVRNCAHKA
ncbi:hypothetical protein D9M70_469290 [compost metagenome]